MSVQESVGHSSLSASLRCTFAVTEKYLKTAEVPSEGTRCGADHIPFQYGAGVERDAGAESIRKRGSFVFE